MIYAQVLTACARRIALNDFQRKVCEASAKMARRLKGQNGILTRYDPMFLERVRAKRSLPNLVDHDADAFVFEQRAAPE